MFEKWQRPHPFHRPRWTCERCGRRQKPGTAATAEPLIKVVPAQFGLVLTVGNKGSKMQPENWADGISEAANTASKLP